MNFLFSLQFLLLNRKCQKKKISFSPKERKWNCLYPLQCKNNFHRQRQWPWKVRYLNFWSNLFKPAYWHISFLSIFKKKKKDVFSVVWRCFPQGQHSDLVGPWNTASLVSCVTVNVPLWCSSSVLVCYFTNAYSSSQKSY